MSDVVPSMRAIIADTDRYPLWLRSLLTEAADEIERLRAEIEERWSQIDALTRWKSEAMQVLAEWEHVWEAAGRPGRLGSSKAAAVKTKLERLQEHS